MSDNNEWMGDLAMTMVQLPLALQKCNIGPDTQKMLGEAIKSLKYAQVKFDFADDNFSQENTKMLMAGAVESWTRWRFEDFGEDVGQLLREMVLLIFPQKYAVDHRGVLRQSLAPQAVPPKAKVKRVRIAGSAFPLYVGFTFAGISALFLATRSLQVFRRPRQYSRYNSVLERCGAPQSTGTSVLIQAEGLEAGVAHPREEELLVQ